jgi:hypothetical protein
MASYVKYEQFVQGLTDKLFDLFGTTDTVKALIHSDAPQSTDDEIADLTQVTGTGYTAGGEDIQNDSTNTTGTITATAVDVVWTGGAGGFTAGRYISTMDDTSTTDRLINSWDYASNFTVAASETFTLDFGASWWTLA